MEVQPKEEEGRERGKCRPVRGYVCTLVARRQDGVVWTPQWQACGAKPPGAVQQFGHTKEFGVAKWIRFWNKAVWPRQGV